MAADSYSLREASEMLGVSTRTLQRRIQEGAFPGRFLAPGRHGLETRLPADEVERAAEDLRRRGHVPGAGHRGDERALARSTITPARELESLVPYQTPEVMPSGSNSASSGSGVTHSDLESLRDAMLAIVREDREMFLTAVRDALAVRDREVVALRQEVAGMKRSMESVRVALESLEQRVVQRRESEQTIDAQMWTDLVEGSASIAARGTIDIDSLLREIGELETLLAGGSRE